MKNLAYISLGSNIGNIFKNLAVARKYISNIPETKIIAKSSIYLTEPQGLKNQPWFANQILKVEVTDLEAITFLKKLLKIEILMGRQRGIRWGPRIIDLDLLLFGNEIINTEDLVLPHPRMTYRAFVLIPILEISPYLKLPTGERLSSFLKKLKYSINGNKIWQED